MCGVCRQQQVQLCQSSTTQCTNEVQEVCQQVPYKVEVPGTKTVQPPPKWQLKCEIKTEMVPQCKVVFETETITVPSRECEQGTNHTCFDYSVPTFDVVSKPMNETVDFPIRNCQVVDKNKEHCAELPTRIDCSDRTVTRSVRINQVLCDQQKQKPVCHRVPSSYCKNVPGQECWMEPREVCQPTCQQSNYCTQCSQFASTGGFSQCATPTCPNFFDGRLR